MAYHKEDESFDEFYAKLKDIVNSTFNLGETIPKPKIVRKVLKSLPERFHGKITVMEESKDINEIPLTELVGNLQTNDLGLTKIGKSDKGKSVALKAKSSNMDKSLDNEDSKMKSYITKKFKKFMKKDATKIEVGNPVLLIRAKTKRRRMLGMAVSTLFPQDLIALGVKASIA